jgi:hypothetical protein
MKDVRDGAAVSAHPVAYWSEERNGANPGDEPVSDAVRPDLFDSPNVSSHAPGEAVQRDKLPYWFMAVSDAIAQQAPHAMLWWPVFFAIGLDYFFKPMSALPLKADIY